MDPCEKFHKENFAWMKDFSHDFGAMKKSLIHSYFFG